MPRWTNVFGTSDGPAKPDGAGPTGMSDSLLPVISNDLPVLQNVRDPVPCKICGGRCALDGVVDFNKNGSEPNGVVLPLLGVPVYYHRCPDCGAVFTVAFDHWTQQDFARHIYNGGYSTVDPDHIEARPLTNSRTVANFVTRAPGIRILDYGGGNGRLAQDLVARGLNACSWDVMAADQHKPLAGSFDLVTCFEVMEHTTTPVETFAEILSFLTPEGVVLFSTLTIDTLPPRSLQFWYIAPRNGHVTIHTRRSLATLASGFGKRLHHFGDGMHLCLTQPPAWLR
jgi:hypothetical protein